MKHPNASILTGKGEDKEKILT